MTISLKFNFPYSAVMKQNHLKIDIDEERMSMREIVKELVTAYPQLLALLTDGGNPKCILITVNGQLGDLDTTVYDGDEIQFLYPYTGG